MIKAADNIVLSHQEGLSTKQKVQKSDSWRYNIEFGFAEQSIQISHRLLEPPHRSYCVFSPEDWNMVQIAHSKSA